MTNWPFVTAGIPDERFNRGEVPMTKEEVRTVTLSKARLKADSIIYDIGAGTGSIAIEAATLSKEGKVYAIEKNIVGVDLIKQNARAFGVANIEVIKGLAPEALKDLPAPDRVIIGGSGGNLEGIIALIDRILKPGGRIVINAIVLETLCTALNCFKEMDYEIEITQVSVVKAGKISELHMMQAQNPVYVIAAERRPI